MKTLITTIFLFTLFISGCNLLQPNAETNSILVCDSVKTNLNVPIAIPNIPPINITTQKSGADIYLHWCYEVKTDSNFMQIIKNVTEIVMQVLKVINQLNIK